MALGNGKTVVGLNLDGQVCRLLLARGQASGASLLASHQIALPFSGLEQEETRRAFLAAIGPILSRHEAQGAPAYLALPAQAASLHPWSAPNGGGLLKSWGQPPLRELTPLLPEEVAWAARDLAGQQRRRQVALAPAALVNALWDLAQEAGLKPQGMDLSASHAALAALGLADDRRPCLCLRLDAAEVSWAWLERGGVGAMGLASVLPGESPLEAAQRAAQEAINAAGLSNEAPVWLWGPGAEDILADQPATPEDSPSLLPRALPLPPMPVGLAQADQPLWLSMTQPGNAASLFALHPQAQATGSRLDSPALTRRLTWAVAGLGLAVALYWGLGYWWDYHQAKSALDQARAEQQALKQQRQNLRAALGPEAAPLLAHELGLQAPRLLKELASRLPAGAWLESLSCQGQTCTLLVAGSTRKELQLALTQDAPWRLTSPLEDAGSRPGAGELLKVELTWEGEAGN